MSDKYELIEVEYADACATDADSAPTIQNMCRWQGVSPSGFYEWRSRQESAAEERRRQLRLLITKIFEDSDGTYGYRRVHAQLERWDVPCGPELVRKLMRELGLEPCQPRPWRHSLTEGGPAGPIPDLVGRDFTAQAPVLRWLFKLSTFDVFIVNYSWLSKAFEFAPPSVVKILDTHDRLAGRRLLLGELGIGPEYFHTTDEQEAIALNRANIVWAIKDEERLLFERLTSNPVFTLAHLDAVQPLPVPAADRDGYLRVGVIAARNSLNLTHLRAFLAAAIPVFERHFAPIMVHVAGSVCDLFHEGDERFVRRMGRVQNVEDFYRAIDVVCVPLQSSTGSKIKTGEAISFGAPVVSLAHSFEGYVPCHPYHRLASFAEMADRLVEIAFDRTLLPDLRDASLLSAQATRRSIAATFERTWTIVRDTRRAIVYCVAASAFDAHAPEHGPFLSALRYLTAMGDVTVLIVEGPLDTLRETSHELESKAHRIVASELVPDDETASDLRRRGYEIGGLAETIARFAQTLVVIDALSEALFAIPQVEARAVLRAEMIALPVALQPRLAMIGAFLARFTHPVVVGSCPSRALGALAGRAGADMVSAPCCWRSDEIRRQVSVERRHDEVLVLADGRLRGLAGLVRALAALKRKPRFIAPDGVDLPAAAERLSAREYLTSLTRGTEALPGFAIDLSFGAVGLQFAKELLQRLNVPVIAADAELLHPSIVAPQTGPRAHTYEALIAKILRAAQGEPIEDAMQRLMRDHELEGEGGWAWLSLYGFETVG